MSIKGIRRPLIIGLLLLLSCDDDSSTSFSVDPSLSYLPLNTGNTWVYRSENKNDSFKMEMEVEKKLMINNKHYFVLSNLYSDSDTIRIVDNTVWIYTNNKEVVLFNFNAGNNTEYEYESSPVTVKKGLTVEVRDREFSNCTGFFFDIPDLADDEQGYIFAKGVGIISMPGAWFNLKLSSHTVVN